ncbi:UDP-glucose 4-epimerase GalE, partial [Ensifer sp. MPMI2T]
ERREGDSTTLVANNDKARAVLGWEPQYDLAAITESAWNWHSRRSGGR